MRRDIQIQPETPRVAFEPLQLAVECGQARQKRLVAVARHFGQQDRLERHQIPREQIILRQPAPEDFRGQIAGRECVQE